MMIVSGTDFSAFGVGFAQHAPGYALGEEALSSGTTPMSVLEGIKLAGGSKEEP